jgi:hypothetical protein
LGIAKSRKGPNLANMVDGPIPLSIFWPKTPELRAHHEQGHCHDARSKHQTKVQVFSDEQLHVALPIFPNNNAGSLFDLSLIFPPGRKHTLVLHCFATTALFASPTHKMQPQTLVTRHCLVITHSLLDATYMQAFRERNYHTSYNTA